MLSTVIVKRIKSLELDVMGDSNPSRWTVFLESLYLGTREKSALMPLVSRSSLPFVHIPAR